MRKFLLFAIAAFASLTCVATSFNTVMIHLSDGSQVDITMTDGLSLSFDEHNLKATGSGADVTIDKSRIVKFVHARKSGVDCVAADGGFSFDGDNLSFSNLPEGSSVVVCALNGAVVRNADACGDYLLPLQGLAPGVYVVSVNGMSYKISVK